MVLSSLRVYLVWFIFTLPLMAAEQSCHDALIGADTEAGLSTSEQNFVEVISNIAPNHSRLKAKLQKVHEVLEGLNWNNVQIKYENGDDLTQCNPLRGCTDPIFNGARHWAAKRPCNSKVDLEAFEALVSYLKSYADQHQLNDEQRAILAVCTSRILVSYAFPSSKKMVLFPVLAYQPAPLIMSKGKGVCVEQATLALTLAAKLGLNAKRMLKERWGEGAITIAFLYAYLTGLEGMMILTIAPDYLEYFIPWTLWITQVIVLLPAVMQTERLLVQTNDESGPFIIDVRKTLLKDSMICPIIKPGLHSSMSEPEF